MTIPARKLVVCISKKSTPFLRWKAEIVLVFMKKTLLPVLAGKQDKHHSSDYRPEKPFQLHILLTYLT